jgi:hypothetical protein
VHGGDLDALLPATLRQFVDALDAAEIDLVYHLRLSIHPGDFPDVVVPYTGWKAKGLNLQQKVLFDCEKSETPVRERAAVSQSTLPLHVTWEEGAAFNPEARHGVFGCSGGDDKNAHACKTGNFTFCNVTAEKYKEQREGIKKHFLARSKNAPERGGRCRTQNHPG